MVAGRFGDLVEAAESHPQYPSLLGSDFSCSDTDSYARQVHLALRLFLRHVRPEPLFRRKDCASAEAARLEGNALFQRREVNKARAAYSKSVICAPKVETVRRDIVCHLNEIEKHLKIFLIPGAPVPVPCEPQRLLPPPGKLLPRYSRHPPRARPKLPQGKKVQGEEYSLREKNRPC